MVTGYKGDWIQKQIAPADRIAVLRERCLQRKQYIPPWSEDARVTAQSLKASEGIASWQVRRGLVVRDQLAGLDLDLDDLELLIGRLAPDRLEWQAERKEAQVFLSDHHPHYYTPGQTGHCELDLDGLFRLGIDGLAQVICERLENVTGARAFVYQSFLDALEGLSFLIVHTAEAAENARTGASAERQVELAEMAVICRKIAHLPPATFHEALQLTWLVLLGVQTSDRVGLVNPGRLDRTLWPYYQRDVGGGRLTRDKALLLLECLYLLLNEYIPDGLAISIMVGGRDAQGNDTTNELSYLCLEALRRTNLIYPTVGVCWHHETPQLLIDLALELIVKGYKQPAFFNDETIQKGLQLYGIPYEEAYSYINSTCVEITPRGCSNVWVASPYFSTCQVLLEEIHDQACSTQPVQTFEEFLAAYQERLACQIAAAVQANNAERRLRQRYGGKPLQSLFTNDCLELGKDIDDGGARYNWAECSFVGLANLIDALHVIREEVFSLRRMSLPEMLSILQVNFEGYEKERLRWLNGYAKYGNDRPEVDSLMQAMAGFIQEECARHRMEPDGSPFVPGAFAWIMHEQLGRECGATPDGRKAGFPFADGCGAAQGREMNGPTAAILSVTSWDAAPLIGGAAFNLKFNRSLFTSPESVQRLKDLILTFLKRGGFETQLNILDSQALKDARANPEKYRDLIVRIGGYTDYFTRLSPGMQEEIILRTEYNQL